MGPRTPADSNRALSCLGVPAHSSCLVSNGQMGVMNPTAMGRENFACDLHMF